MVTSLRKITHDALAIEIETPRTYKESVDLFRIGKNEINKNPDGIDFSGRTFELLSLFGLMTRKAAMDRDSSGFKKGRNAVLANTDTAMAHIWMVTPTNTRIATGCVFTLRQPRPRLGCTLLVKRYKNFLRCRLCMMKPINCSHQRVALCKCWLAWDTEKLNIRVHAGR